MSNEIGNLTPAQICNDLFYLNNSNLGVDEELRSLYAGNGVIIPMKISSEKIQIDNLEIDNIISSYTALSVNDIGNQSGSYQMSTAAGNLQKVRLTGNLALTILSNVEEGYGFEILLAVEQSSGGHSITFPGTFRTPNDVALTFSSGAAKIDILKFITHDAGETWYVCNLSGTGSSPITSVTLTGDVTGTGTSSIATTIGSNVVTLAMMAQIATASILGRNTAGTGNVEVLSAATTKTLLSLNNVENTALSTWAGTTNITTLGTISTGTWNATTIGVTKGGTGTTTQFTLGSVVFAGASGVYTQDNTNFFWDDTNNRLGLGTNSPNQQLELTGNIRLSASIATTPSAIYMGATKWFHTYGETATESTNIFLGPNSGNTTLTRGTAVRNIAFGRSCLQYLTSGAYNLSFGDQCGRFITTGTYNVNIGDTAGYSTDTANFNLNIGAGAGYSITSSSTNINIGNGAGGGYSTSSGGNICIGGLAARWGNVAQTLAIGTNALETGSGTPLTADANTVIGNYAQSQGCTPAYGPTITPNLTNLIVIGAYAVCTVSYGIVLGKWSNTSMVGGIGTHAPGAQWHTRANRAGQTALIADGFTSASVDIAQFRTTTDGSLSGSGSGTWTTQARITKDGDLALENQRVIQYKQATNATAGSRAAGTVNLASGTVTVNTTAVLTGDKIEIMRQAANGSTAYGHLMVGTIVNATSFVIDSRKSDTTVETNDASTVFWRIVRTF